MSDLDTSLRELRDELHAAIPLPDVERVAWRARTRRRLQVGAIAAVVAAALAVPVLRALPSSDVRPADPPPAPTTSRQIDFFDAEHGYALVGSCTPACSFTLHATADGGRTWARRTLPAPLNAKSGYFNAGLCVLGPDEVALDRPGVSTRVWMDRIHSADGGRSWRVLQDPYARDRSASISPDGLMTAMCLPQSAAYVDDHVATIEPGSGLTVPLVAQPQLTLQRGSASPTEDGTWWVTGRDRTTGRWTIAVSEDDGRTWRARAVQVAGVPSSDGWAVVERNGVVYATAANSSKLLGVWRSTDEGRTWTRTWSADGDQWLPNPAGTPVAAGDGSLVLYDGTTTYVSTDLGRTFERTGDEVTDTVWWTRGGYLRVHGDEYALSADGVRWRAFRVG